RSRRHGGCSRNGSELDEVVSGFMPTTRSVRMSAARKYLASKAAQRKLQPTLYFTMNCLLLTKAEGTPQNGDPLPQEDVDAYLSALRDQFEAQVPLPSERTRLLSRYDVGAWRRLANTSRGALKYLILRTPDDLLLISAGVFEHHGPHVPSRRDGMLPGEEADVGRSPNWYHFTYTYGELLENPTETIGAVLEKLTLGLERYHKLLSHMKGEYWSVSRRFKKAQVIRLERKVDEDAKEQMLRDMQDDLLDAYSEWKKTGERKLLDQMRGLAREIRQLSPDFHFSLPAGGS
ncbi:MAG: hypothetical protein ACRD1Z_21125, partial [Vicinamibacteria bacterium]